MNTEILLGAVGALGGVVAILWRRDALRTDETLKRIEVKLDACESDRAALWERLVKIEESR